VQPNEFSAVAVFDDHGAVGGSGAAGWREHRVDRIRAEFPDVPVVYGTPG